MRLNSYIAKCGAASRRGADKLIQQGKIMVNGKIVLKPFFCVDEHDRVEFGGEVVNQQNYAYIIINKPKGVTTTVRDAYARKNVIELLPAQIRSETNSLIKRRGIYPVGRLDKDSTGLLILTNDGELCYKTTHPKFEIEKEYILELKGLPNKDILTRAKRGLKVSGDFLKVNQIRIISQSPDGIKCSVVISEGKKRHLRRLFAALGFSVCELKRIRIGKLSLGSLAPGKFRYIKREKIYFLLFNT